MDAEIEESSLPKLTYRFDNIHINYDRRDYSPSMMKGKTIVKGFTDFGQRIPLGKLPKDIEMDTVGNCIHHIYRLCKNSYPDESVVSNVISSYGLTTTLCDIKEIQKAWRHLLNFIEDHHGQIVSHEHERPFIMHNNGKVYTGSIDLSVSIADGIDANNLPKQK